MIKKFLSRCARYVWYEDVFIASWLTVFSMLFVDVVRFRRFLYRRGTFNSTKLSCPVIVVGNITVGGTGKTPLVIALANYLKQAGFRPGIISRGYGGNADVATRVTSASNPESVGDEAILIATHTGCPTAVAVQRAEAGQLLLNQSDCNLIISDDGLQHYALQRDIEIAVVDGTRRFGNNSCLPGGPLREPLERLNEVDFIVVNGTSEEVGEIPMTINANSVVNLRTGEKKLLTKFKGQRCHALAGIGNPERFFDLLTSKGLTTENHSFPDHHTFKAKEILFAGTSPVLMTEKDAVKCKEFATDNYWYVPISADLPESFFNRLLNLLK